DYAFAPDRPLKSDVVKIQVFPGLLILEGCLRLPLMALRERVPQAVRLFPAADPPYHLEQLKFTADQALLIALADGTKTVADLLQLSDLEERAALGLLHGLQSAGLLEVRSDAPAARRRVSY